MINKEVKSSERERESNSYTRATAISLNSIDEKVRSLEGTSRAVPIDMKSLDDRINNLIATAQSYQIINYSDRGTNLDITAKYGMKLNSDSMVILANARVESFSTIKYHGPVKGDFSILVAQNSSNTTRSYYLKRVGNNISISGYSGSITQSGTIIILN